MFGPVASLEAHILMGAWARIRNWGAVRTRYNLGKQIITGNCKDGEDVACVISTLLCWSSKGSGSIMANDVRL